MNQAAPKYGISASDLSLGQLAVIFPVFHLLMSTIFVWGYCAGFGFSLAVFTTTSDIFTFSISSMIPIYAASFLTPIAILAVRYSRPHTNAHDAVMAIADPQERQQAMDKLEVTRNYILVGAFALSLLIMGMAVWDAIHGNRIQWVLIGAVPGFLMVYAFVQAKNAWNLDALTYEFAYIVGYFAIACVTFGLDRGQIDRHREYKASQGDFFQCGNNIVIRKIGDNFLVVKPDNTKAMVNQECKELFSEAPNPKAPKKVQAPPKAKTPEKVPAPSPKPA